MIDVSSGLPMSEGSVLEIAVANFEVMRNEEKKTALKTALRIECDELFRGESLVVDCAVGVSSPKCLVSPRFASMALSEGGRWGAGFSRWEQGAYVVFADGSVVKRICAGPCHSFSWIEFQ